MITANLVFSDPELMAAARNGDISAFAGLYARHADAAHRLARVLTSSPGEAEGLVSDTFAAVRLELSGGGGPSVIFRTYLLSTMREVRADQRRHGRRLRGTSPASAYEPEGPPRAVGVLDPTAFPVLGGSVAAEALMQVPARWQLILWHVIVEREPAAAVANLVGLTPGEVTKLYERALDRLHAAYLGEVARSAAGTDCQWFAHHLEASRHELTDPERERFSAHLADCGTCRRLSIEYTELEHNPIAVLAPLVLGNLAPAYCAASDPVPVGAGSGPLTPDGQGRNSERRTPSGRRRLRIALVAAAAVAIMVGAATAAALKTPVRTPAPIAATKYHQSVAGTGSGAGLPAPTGGSDVAVNITGNLHRGRTNLLQIVVGNTGPQSSGQLTVVIVLPAGSTVRTGLGPPWSCAGRTTTLVCTHPALGSGGTTSAVLGVRVDPSAPAGGRASAVVSPATPDPVSANNRAEAAAGIGP
ncbi:MAG: sigma-70 family RNA polymerase sigma factor [Mycobacteriales bacterium]